jgi:competence protein ComEA
MTPSERKALLFLAVIGVLGVGARIAGSAGEQPRVRREDARALDAQVAAVDSAMARERPARGRATPRARVRRTAADDGTAHDVTPPARRARRASPRVRERSPTSEPAGPIDVDVADAATLEALPGVGPALAERIVAERVTGGAYGSLEALGEVRGVGPKLLARLSSHVTFSGIPRPIQAGGRRRAPR